MKPVYKLLIVAAIITFFYGFIYSLTNSDDNQWSLTIGAVIVLVIAVSLLKTEQDIEYLKAKNKQLEYKLDHPDNQSD